MLDRWRDELTRMGYSIVSVDGQLLIGMRSKWHWDCIATKLTTVVFVRVVGELTAAMIQWDSERMIEQAKGLDPSKIPQGFQKGLAVVPVYIAGTVEPDARVLLTSEPKFRMATFVFPAALDGSTGEALYLRHTPILGWVYFSKFRYIAQRLLEPTAAPDHEPLSVPGAILGAFTLLLIPMMCGLLGFTLWLMTTVLAH